MKSGQVRRIFDADTVYTLPTVKMLLQWFPQVKIIAKLLITICNITM